MISHGHVRRNHAKNDVMVWLKKVFKNFEWPGLAGMFGFLTLTFVSVTQGHEYFAVVIFVLGVFFICIASYNSHRNKSIELLDRYEERFFIKMKEERRLAAQYLLGQRKGSAHFKYVIDFFDSPIASKVAKRQIDVKGVYEYFSHWIQLYWQAGHEDIEIYHKNDPGAWPSLIKLYDSMVAMDKKELKERYSPWTPERLKDALEDEGSL
jgi:hypothetical protein